MSRIISVRNQPEQLQRFVDYFVEHWASEETVALYRDGIGCSLDARFALPQWYLLLDEAGAIIGGVGLITNDFISRMDLLPWLCALHVEEPLRGQGHGGRLVEHACAEARRLGFDSIHLCTEHVGYYERHGFAYVGDGHHPWGESSRVYSKALVAA